MKHVPQIKKALGITGVYSKSSAFYQRADEADTGAQIDLVIDRNDQVINVFEIKFYNSEYTLTEVDAKSLQNKLRVFRGATGTKKHLMMSMVATFGIKHNRYSLGLVEQVLTLNDLF